MAIIRNKEQIVIRSFCLNHELDDFLFEEYILEKRKNGTSSKSAILRKIILAYKANKK